MHVWEENVCKGEEAKMKLTIEAPGDNRDANQQTRRKSLSNAPRPMFSTSSDQKNEESINLTRSELIIAQLVFTRTSASTSTFRFELTSIHISIINSNFT